MKTQMEKDIAKAAGALKNGRKYSLTFLALVAARDWQGVEELFPSLESSHGQQVWCNEDKAIIREMAAVDGYEIKDW